MRNFLKRPRFRFSLAILLLGVTVVCIWLGRISYLARQQRAAVAAILAAEGIVIYDFEENSTTTPPAEPGPKWLVDLIGPEYFQSVQIVSFATNNGRRSGTNESKATPEALAALADLPYLENIELSHNLTVDDAALENLAGLSELKILYLFRCNVQGSGLAHLQRDDKLEHITLDYAPIVDSQLEAVQWPRSLKTLALRHATITDEGMKHLARLPAIERLALNYTGLTDQGLAQLEGLKTLKDLELHGTEVTPAGVARFNAAIPGCKVWLDYDFGKDVVAEPLFPPEAAPTADEINARLKELRVDGEVSTRGGVPGKAIVEWSLRDSMMNDVSLTPLLPRMSELEMLNFRHVAVGDDFVRELKVCPELNYVSLEGTRITDDGLAAFSALPKLSQLYLNQTDITDAGLPHLYGLQQLTMLKLENTRVTREGVEQLRRKLPNCTIGW